MVRTNAEARGPWAVGRRSPASAVITPKCRGEILGMVRATVGLGEHVVAVFLGRRGQPLLGLPTALGLQDPHSPVSRSIVRTESRLLP